MNPENETVADFEQIETQIVATARAIAGYYRELRKGMLPPELINHLVAEFARQWWTDFLGLNEQHVFIHHDPDGEE